MPACRPWSHNCRVIFFCVSKAIFAVWGRAILCLFILSLCLTPGAARAQISQLSDDVLSGISGQSGLSIMMDGSAIVHYDFLSFSDTQTTNRSWIELYDFNVDNGPGVPFSFATSLDSGPNTVNVWTDVSGVTRVSTFDTSQMNPRTYSVGSLVINAYDIKNYSVDLATAVTTYLASNPDPGLSLAYWANPATPSLWDSADFVLLDGLNDINIDPLIVKYQASVNHTNTSQPLGSIKLDSLRQGPSLYRVWAHSSGISFDYTTTLSASALTYTYNTTPTTLSLTGINIAGSATGNPQDPTFTTVPWVFSGTFKIGTIGDPDVYDINSNLIFVGNQPATIDVGTDNSNNSYISQNLPMSGTIRVADVNFGGKDFGPVAIDNLQVHRLNLKISP
jgi:hypothetical protein